MNKPESRSKPVRKNRETLVSRAQTRLNDLIGLLSRRRVSERPPVATWLAAATFVVVSVIAVVTFPYDLDSIRWTRLIWTGLALVPATAVLNGFEFHLGARLMSLDVRLTESFRIGLFGSAANNLPIPGAVMVRVGAMARLGSTVSRAGSVTVANGIMWVSSACAVAGFVVWLADSRLLGLLVLIFGVALGAMTGLFLWRLSASDQRSLIVFGMAAVEVALVIVTALRFFVALSALGTDASASQSAVLALSVVVAAAIGIFPAGLGIRELVAGLLAPIVSLEPSLGLAATVVDRTVAMIALGLLTIAFGVNQMNVRRRGLAESEPIE